MDAERNTYTQTYDLVDMGTLNWRFDTTTWRKSIFYANIRAKAYGSNIFSSMYKVSDAIDPKDLSLYEIKGYRTDRSVYVYDDRYTSAADFKAAMAGVQLAYELAEPVENSLLSEAEKSPPFPAQTPCTRMRMPCGWRGGQILLQPCKPSPRASLRWRRQQNSMRR